MEKLSWLDYTGQTTSELIGCKKSHRIDSLLCAFEEGIQAKLDQAGAGSITGEEDLVLAVMALEREVNNGGYDQFFLNSSRRFVPIIVDCLLRIQCAATAAITERAIATLRLQVLSADTVSAAIQTEEPGRDEVLNACNNEFYQINEIEPKLFSFLEAHQDQIRLVRASIPSRRKPASKFGNTSKLFAHLMCAKQAYLSLDGVRQLARELAKQNSIPVTDAELEGAAVLHSFACSLRAGDLRRL